MPSVVYRDRRGHQTVGVRAADLAGVSPDNGIEGFKRLMGTSTPLRFASTGESISPEQASAEILKALTGQAMVEAGSNVIDGVVVTIPAAFNQLQCEATLAAARSAGLERVALLQEPVAASLASMAGLSDRNGLFMVFDLGGGTFDAALVHANDGEVTVLAHEGINSLGGRDLDRRLMESHIFPWLRKNFDLPSNFTVDPRFLRLGRMARKAAERAKIELSNTESARIYASDDDIRLLDLKDDPIYLDTPISRLQLETMAVEMISRSIGCCRDMLAHVGYRHEDVSKIVFIGGPTKMPFLRKRVREELAIEALEPIYIDPMTAVATGAAIYSESREWTKSGSLVKASRQNAKSGGTVEVAFDYQSRTSSQTTTLRVRQVGGESGAEISIENRFGWTSGRIRLTSTNIEIQLPLKEARDHEFEAMVFDKSGHLLPENTRTFSITRTLAQSNGAPAAHTIAIKIRSDNWGKSDANDANSLECLIQKNTDLPATGAVSYRLAESLKAGSSGSIKIELYEVAEGVPLQPHLHLMVGEFIIGGRDLPSSMTIRKGDEIRVHWAMSDSQTLTAEVEIPAARQRFDRSNYYDRSVGHIDFSAETGRMLALEHASRVQKDIEDAEDSVPSTWSEPMKKIRHDLEETLTSIKSTMDPIELRKGVEDIRLLRQKIAVICQEPATLKILLSKRLEEQINFYNRDIRNDATSTQTAEVDALIHNAQASLKIGEHSTASQLISQINACYWRHGFDQLKFCAWQFQHEKKRRHRARSPEEFDEFTAAGDKALEAGDLQAVRQALISILIGQIPMGSENMGAELASIMRQ